VEAALSTGHDDNPEGRAQMRELTVQEQEQVGGGTFLIGKLIIGKLKAIKAAKSDKPAPKHPDPDDC